LVTIYEAFILVVLQILGEVGFPCGFLNVERMLSKFITPLTPPGFANGGTGAVEDIKRYAFGTPQAAPMGVPRQQSFQNLNWGLKIFDLVSCYFDIEDNLQ